MVLVKINHSIDWGIITLISNYKTFIKEEFWGEYRIYFSNLLNLLSKLLINSIYIDTVSSNQWDTSWEIDVGSRYIANHIYLISICDFIIGLNAILFDKGSDTITITRLKEKIINYWVRDQYKISIKKQLESIKWNGFTKKLLKKCRSKVLCHNKAKKPDLSIDIKMVINVHSQACIFLDMLSFGKVEFGNAKNYNSIKEYFEYETKALRQFVLGYLWVEVFNSHLIKQVYFEPDKLCLKEKESI